MSEVKKRLCEKCRAMKKEGDFYKSNNLERYPDTYLTQCKDCITMHVDNWEPDTYLWILQECDVPYVPDKWNKILSKQLKEGSVIKGTSVLGRYLSSMKLAQYKKYRWADTEFLQEQNNRAIEAAMTRSGYSAAEIAAEIEKGIFPIPEKPLQLIEPKSAPEVKTEEATAAAPVEEAEEPFVYEGEHSIVDTLTDEDKVYLCVKWGKSYKPYEWVQLEQFYKEMMESYDIQSAGHIDTLKMICKTSLKANQLLDLGDIDGAQKMVKMYDMLMKSGKFKLWTMKYLTSSPLGSWLNRLRLTGKPKHYRAW